MCVLPGDKGPNVSVKRSGSLAVKVGGMGKGWETDVAFSHQKFDGEVKEEMCS